MKGWEVSETSVEVISVGVQVMWDEAIDSKQMLQYQYII